MRSCFGIASRARLLAICLTLGAAGSLVTASASQARFGTTPQAPTTGVNCQSSDGKISGRGSTFQDHAVFALVQGYQNDVCGAVGAAPAGTSPGQLNVNTDSGNDPSGVLNSISNDLLPNGMVGYNYVPFNTTTADMVGSGNGRCSMDLREDIFAGADTPYSNANLTELDEAPGSYANDAGNKCGPGGVHQATPITPSVPMPYQSAPSGGYPEGGSAANMMSFPIAGGAVADGYNLAGVCTTTPTQTLQLTNAEESGIWQGTINEWQSPTLAANNSWLTTDGCTGSITRVVRLDNSGTTSIQKQYMVHADGSTLCDGNTWSFYFSNNQVWPQQSSANATCTSDSDTSTAAQPVVTESGTPNLINYVENNGGTIGYDELGNWTSLPSTVKLASVENASGTAEVSPGSPGSTSNCNDGANGLPAGGTASGAVGLGGTNANWSNNSSPNYEDITYKTTFYPICGLTWDFMYSNVNDAAAGVANPYPAGQFTADQYRTLYSYFTYVFSPAGQANLSSAGYDQLPSSWLSSLRTGFQDNF